MRCVGLSEADRHGEDCACCGSWRTGTRLIGLQVVEMSGALAELQVAQELHALRATRLSKATPRLVGSYRVGKLHYIVTA